MSNPFLALPTNRAAKPGVHRSGYGPAAISVLKIWEKLAAEGSLDARKTINIFGKALEPEFGNKTITRLHPGTWDMESFWGQVFTVALTGSEIRPEVEVRSEVDAPAVHAALMDEDTSAGASVYAPATPTDEETRTRAQAD